MSAITTILDLLSSFITLITTGVSAIVDFCQSAFAAVQSFFVFLPDFIIGMILLIFAVKIVYLILGR